MIIKTKFEKATGRLLHTASGPEGVVVFPDDALHGWVDGDHDPALNRVEAGLVVPIAATIVEQRTELAAWAALRVERDRRLTASDWTQLPDAPVDQAAWAAYRTALRALPDTTSDPYAPVWPVPPQM